MLRNDNVAEINTAVLHKIPGGFYKYLSTDRMEDEDGANMVPTEYLDRLTVSGWPPLRLLLKEGTPIMLLRNLAPANGLCNGTRLIVQQCLSRVIKAQVLNGDHAGYGACIPRIPLVIEHSGLPFAIRRRQFPCA